eukprot:TRINITY_DN17861_c0_g1_i1.p1 TRINITY_DN17861_c0_g1~~TRINITY_DN17861_c0_g1_i1.p1  ORF type:complete len:318 (-),score=41.44 TRINITY_DN17861_c0_g1_i1:257-1210(-)
MPGSGSESGLAVDVDLSFDSSVWLPAKREYGLFDLLMCRSTTPVTGPGDVPEEVMGLKFVDTRTVSQAMATPRRDPFSSDDEGCISDDEHKDATEPAVAWPGKEGSWWRVHSALGEDVIVRDGVSLSSNEIRRINPSDLLQQAGSGRTLTRGRARGCVRVPVQPCGWVTADASKAGGPKYLVRASAPRWRVAHNMNNKDSEAGDAIVREDPTLDSLAVAVLHYGDIVEQAGPSLTRSDGIVRMPVTHTVVRRGDCGENGEPAPTIIRSSTSANGKISRILGWVTVDATAAGGPVFFKSMAEDKDKRRRRPRQQWPGP